ncbi:MAG: glycoside hydrolase N-terminal domain-containing protein [Lentisphaeria bacterium]|nr:glycoside hydrolase N-terminal domain-containing protein [Lentisphaeria bacterium]
MNGLLKKLERLYVTYPSNGCVSLAPAARWDDGTIVGNGMQGVLAYCCPHHEEMVLSHEEMFLPLFPFHGYLPIREHYQTIQRLVMEKRVDEAQQLIKRVKVEGDFPFYNTTDPFVGACSLDMLMRDDAAPALYMRSTDFATGEAVVAWETPGGLFHRQFFVSRDANVIVVRLSSPTGAKLDLSVGLREIAYAPEPHPKAQDIYGETIDHCKGWLEDDIMIHRMHFKRRWATQPLLGSATVGRVVARGGSLTGADGRFVIRDADELLLIIRTIPERNGEAFPISNQIAALRELPPDYDALLGTHAALHGEIFGRCSLTLSAPESQRVATEDLQAGSSVGNTDPALVEKACSAGRYGVISSTGTLPPLLQGVWTGTWKPRWSGDYTLNGNVQSMVAASLCGNHYECQETLMNYLDSLMDDFRENARELLGFRGPLIPWRSSTHGKTHYLSCFGYYHDFPGTYWFAGAGWFARIYYDYYLYTGDEAFFANRLKPFLLDAAALYEDYLTLKKDGKYVLSPSSSPENEIGPNLWMVPNATMTIAVIKELIRTCLRHTDKLGAGKARVERWHEILAGLPDYEIGANGALKEWTWPGIENEEAHRHASHLYPLYFGVAPEIAESPELQEACRVAIDRRMDFRRTADGLDMAFGLVQLGMAAAHLGDVSLAYESLEYLVNSYWSPAMASMHNVHDVFNLDISGGLPALVITMLAQSHPQRDKHPNTQMLKPPKKSEAANDEEENADYLIQLLPCLPEAWHHGALRGMRCRGGFELDIEWEKGELKAVRVTSLLGRTARLEYKNRSTILTLCQGEQCAFGANLVPSKGL